MKLLAAILDRRIFFNLLFYLLLVGGFFAWRSIPVDVYPDVPFNEATITTVWPGATAKEVELLVTQKLEDEIVTLQNLVKLRSRSSRNRSLINIKFQETLGAQEFQNRLQDLRDAVARVGDLPEECEQPIVQKLSTWELWPLCKVVVSGGSPGQVFQEEEEFQVRQVARDLKPKLRAVDGVQKVTDSFRDPEVHASIELGRLWELGYTLDEVAERLRYLNRDFSAGQLSLSSGQLVLSTKGGREDPRALEDLVLFERTDRSPIRLGDLAHVGVGFEEAFVYERFNRRPCLTLAVVKEGAADSVQVVEAIKARVAEAKADIRLPEGVELAVVLDSSQIIRSRIKVLVNNLAGGILFVGVLLWLSLGARNAFLALLGIPFSVLCALLLFEPLGLTINAISLFSLVLVSGMVVDDAIVVLESIYQRVEQGAPLREAVIRGTAEVIPPVFASTLTTLSAFLPMFLTEGIMGRYFAVIPKTVTVALVASLFECFLILPIHYLEWGPRTAAAGSGTDGLIPRWARKVAELNRRLIQRPWVAVAVGILLVAGAGALSSRIPVQLFPSDFQIYAVTAQLPEGTSLEQSRRAAVFIEDQIQEQVDRNEVQYFVSTVGVAWSQDNILVYAPDMVQVTVFMHEDEPDAEARLLATQRLLTEAFAQDPRAPQLRNLVVAAPNDGPPTGKPVQVRLQVSDYELGERLARRTEEFLASVEGLHSVDRDIDRGPLRVDLAIREGARALEGIDEARVGRIFQTANIGARVGTFKDPRYGEAYDTKVILAREDRDDLQDLVATPLRHPKAGVLLPLSEVARLEARSSFKARPHYGGRRAVTIMADVDITKTTASQANALLAEWLDASGVAAAAEAVHLGGEFEETNKSFASMGRAFLLAILLIYIILATQFRSYSQPFVILVSVPFAFIGVVLGLLALAFPFTITSFVAIVGLSGVVVNDVIVMVALINRLRRQEGYSADDAIVEGVRLRFRPILMTSATTIIGLAPMAMGLGGFSKIWSPFAATMCFGLLSALVLILGIVPSLIKLVDQHAGAEAN